ncbi:trichohyalin-like [Megalops cyprinoides]|uniref:trichohyalin-like n=1 Tax=Megalops cyprinoides TaxID=118141 RepID=UPI001864D94C|nr:trichohyalin-like [Megalops cyprinoides]
MRKGGEGRRSPKEYSKDGWGSELGWSSRSQRKSFRASSPLSLSHLDMWDKRSHFKAHSSVWSNEGGVSGPGLFSSHSSSSPGSDCEMSLRASSGMRRWQSLSRLAPDGAPRSLSPSPGAELRAALAESGARRAELVQRLREAQERLDSQTDLLKARDTQLHHSQTTAQLLELRHKQLADAVSALEQEKETAELCRFEESRRRSELQDKVLQLELDMLKMRSMLERRSPVPPAHPLLGSTAYQPSLSRTLPTTQEDFGKQEKQQVERELREAREALRESQERLESLEAEREQALHQLRSAKEGHLTVLSQVEETNQRLSSSMQAQSELQDKLSDARSQLGQASLERDLLSSKLLRMEDNLEDVKVKLTGAMADKDRLMQEKAELHQRVQSLELQLERAQRGQEGFTDQVCELHGELVEAKAQVNRQDKEKLQMKEELHTIKQSNERMTSELEEARRRLEAVLSQLHELEAEKVIHTNQISALETERSQLLGEREELLSAAQQSNQEEVTVLRENCHELRESQNALLQENQELQSRCQTLEAGILEREAELQRKGEENERREAEMAQEVEELRRVVSHWKERWQEVALASRLAQDELEDIRRRHSAETTQLKEEAARLAQEVERLQREFQSSQDQAQNLLQQKVETEAELNRVKREAGALAKVELDACRQQLELERSRSQALLQRLSSSPEVDGELSQVRAELQKVWDMLRVRDSELEEQQQELQSARGQVSQQSSEVQRLEEQLTMREQELEQKERVLNNLQRLRETERNEMQLTVSSLEMKLAELREERAGELQRRGGPGPVSCSDPVALRPDALRAQVEEIRRRTAQLQVERDQAVQTLQELQQGKAERAPPESKKEICSENPDQDKQRRMVTEQLKSLFKEREQLARAYDKSPGAHRRGRSPQEWATQSKVIKNALDTLNNQKKREQELLQEGERLHGAADRAVPEGRQDASDNSQLQEQKQMVHLKEELHSKTIKMSAMSVEINNLREKNDNLLQAKLRDQQQIQDLRGIAPSGGEGKSGPGIPDMIDSPVEGNSPVGSFFHCEDGTYLARQVKVRGSEDEEEEEEEEEKKSVSVLGEAGGHDLQDSWNWDGASTPTCTNVPSIRLLRSHSTETLSLPFFLPSRGPDPYPLSPLSCAGSQECLLSPRPYRPQPTRSFRSAENSPRAASTPSLELK